MIYNANTTVLSQTETIGKLDTFKKDPKFELKNTIKQEVPEAKKKLKWYEFETKIIWPNMIVMIVWNILCIHSWMVFPFRQHKFLIFWGFFIGYIAAAGVCIGAHRLWTHRSYKAKTPLRILLAVCYYIAGQQSIYTWVRNHRVHHAYSDTDADPHNSKRGFWFSHLGWLVLKKKPEVRKRDTEVDMSDILNDPVCQFFDRNYKINAILFTFVIPTVIPVLLVNESLWLSFMSQVLMRYPVQLHCAWTVNSIAHKWGMKPYNKDMSAVQSALSNFLTFGEGLHNYHHAFPRDYKASDFGFYNPHARLIELWARMGWAYDLISMSPEQIQRMKDTKGDGSY